MVNVKGRVSSGIDPLDRQLGGLFIGDNVLWYDSAGSLASVFCGNFIKASLRQKKPLIYITFDRSPKTLLTDLGRLAESPLLTILDCFTYGKGDGSDVFSTFYEKGGARWPFQIVRVHDPATPEFVSDAVYNLHGNMKGDVRLVFDSLTGMQDLWEGEDAVLRFYSRACPRLYELDTIAYWVIEKGAHTERLQASMNQIAQVAVALSLRRGKSTLTILKADKRNPDALNLPLVYWQEGMEIFFEMETGRGGNIDLGPRLKRIRNRQGISQKKLAGLVGVTPSTVSQIESGTIYPSIPALCKIAEALHVSAAAFFQRREKAAERVVFSGGGIPVSLPDAVKHDVHAYRLLPPDVEARGEPYFIDIPAGTKLALHFFIHKGEELGYVLNGTLEMKIGNRHHRAESGDLIYLAASFPSRWENTGGETARLLWIKIKR